MKNEDRFILWVLIAAVVAVVAVYLLSYYIVRSHL